MRKVGFLLGAVVLLALALAPAFAAQPFADVPQDHWAYNAVEKLAADGLIEGYPDGTFGGKRTLTRYEFAVALARLMERMETMGGVPGPQGPAGPMGPPGPAGSGGGADLTAEQQALLNRLATEFAPELANLRSELAAINGRLADLEAMCKVAPAGPSVTVSGKTNWRTGVYGTKLGFEDVESTGYFGAGSIVPASDTLKDAFKAGDFMTMRTLVNISANISSNTSAYVQLLAGPTTNLTDPYDVVDAGNEPNLYTGTGLMDMVQIDQAWLKTSTRFIAPVDLTIGKQYLRRGVGLLFDNDQAAIKALRADFGSSSFRMGTLLGMLDNEQFYQPWVVSSPSFPTNGQDNITLLYLDFALGQDWKLGGNWLHSGFNKEQGWSASLTGQLIGLDLYGEYSQLTNTASDLDPDDVIADSDTAWLAGLKWSTPAIELTGEYGEVDAGYAIAFSGSGWGPIPTSNYFNLPLSALHPRAEIDPHDINWIDRPLFLDATNIARGWHVQATFPTLLGAKMPLTVSYATGDRYDPADVTNFIDADPVWWAKLSRQMSDAVTASLLYGRREAEELLDDPNADALQVIRAEVSVSF